MKGIKTTCRVEDSTICRVQGNAEEVAQGVKAYRAENPFCIGAHTVTQQASQALVQFVHRFPKGHQAIVPDEVADELVALGYAEAIG